MLEIDDVQSARVAAGELRLVVDGRWLGPHGPSAAQEPLLVVQVEGHRHRFTPEVGPEPGSPPGAWRASFVLPAWAEPRRAGQGAVWVGDAVIPLPAVHAGRGGWAGGAPPAVTLAAVAADPAEPETAQSETVAPEGSLETGPGPGPSESHEDTPRSGPLADMLLKETVAALHAELEQRGTEAAQLRSALGGALSELEARSATQAELEGTLGELGSELRRLMEAVEEQRSELGRRQADTDRERAAFERERAESEHRLGELAAARDQQAAEVGALREQLASASVARDAARSEAAGLRSELERLGAELALTRERVESETGDLGEAHRLLAEAKALADELRARPAGG